MHTHPPTHTHTHTHRERERERERRGRERDAENQPVQQEQQKNDRREYEAGLRQEIITFGVPIRLPITAKPSNMRPAT
jgi:hypothetical protein